MKLAALLLTMLALTRTSVGAWGEQGWWTVGTVRMGMLTLFGASDGPDSSDYPASEQNGWMAGSYHSPDEWGDSAGFYIGDVRAPLALGETKTWILYIWGVPGSATHDFGVSWTASSDPLLQGRLEFVQKPAGVAGGPELGTVWTTPPSGFTLPLYTTDDGLTGYGFTFTLTMIPEPSSLLALTAGIGGLGLGLRRKRRG